MMSNDKLKYGIGIDVSKDHFHVCFMIMLVSGKIKIAGTTKFAQTKAGFQRFLTWIEKRRKDPSLSLQVALEATGVYHEELLHFLYREGLDVCLILPKISKDYRKSMGSYSKNDKADSKVLAHLSIHRKLRSWEPASQHIYQIRSLLRLRRSLISSRVSFQNQLHAFNYAHQPLAQIGQTLKQVIEQLNEQITQSQAQAIELAKEDQELWENLRKIEASFKGLGVLTLLEVIAETNGFTQFHSIKQLISYAGYDIIENQSGKFEGKTRISKKGNARIRTALHMAALVVIRCKVLPFYDLYLRVRKRNPKIKMKAHVAVQRKLLVYIYTLWKNKQAFDPNYPLNQAKKTPQKSGSSETSSELHGIVNQINPLPIN